MNDHGSKRFATGTSAHPSPRAAIRDRFPAARLRAIALALAGSFAGAADAGITYIVNTNADPDGVVGSLSLRRAIEAANTSAGNTVQFDAALSGSTITLASGEIVISQPMQVVGPGPGKLTISGNDVSRVFKIATTSTATQVKISGLTLTHGYTNNYLGGGAICFDHGDAILQDVRVTDSRANVGGGISDSIGFLQVIDSVVTGNVALRGGGIWHAKGKLTLQSSSVSYNVASSRGGGIYVSFYNNLNVYYSTISGNVVPAPSDAAPQGGGGIYDLHSILKVRQSTIAQNYAYQNGGGIYIADAFASSHAQISRSTIALNDTCCYTGGNGILAVAGGTIAIDQSIVANDGNRNGLDDLAGSFNVTGSLIRNPGSAILSGSATTVGVDPKLGPLGYHGGPRQTMVPAPGSPALDALATCGTLDQRGYPRCVNGADDIGAVERQAPENVVFIGAFGPEG